LEPIFFSIIIPLYNRPEEIKELLLSLCLQTYKHFEVLVIEDGSTQRANDLILTFHNKINIRYFYKPNSGQGFSRNYGFERAEGKYFIIFDSDVLVPENYLDIVYRSISSLKLDAYGGPDAAHPSFTPLQKAISYSMTSIFTTGGIRGKNTQVSQNFHPRSFNMGFSREVWEKTKGFIITRSGEDIELSIRIQSLGFHSALIPEAFVYHKRRTNLEQFFKQVHFFGRARINIYTFFPKELKWVHFIPAAFTIFCAITLIAFLLANGTLFSIGFSSLLLFSLVIFIDSSIENRSLWIGLLSIATSFTQLIGYGIGFITDFVKRILLKPKS
jgi:glycosyltransferase involved in cell wall biosynthesis